MTVVLVAVTLVGVLGALRALGAADVKARDAELLQRLASRKWEELGTVADPQAAEDRGDFADAGHPEVDWTLAVEPSGTAENIETVTVTARRSSDGAEQSLTGLVFVRPVTGGAGDAGNTGGAAGGATP